MKIYGRYYGQLIVSNGLDLRFTNLILAIRALGICTEAIC